MAEVKWIKVSTEMFSNNRKIKQIEVMPEGDAILVIWLKLLLLAGNINDGGAIYLTPEIPYTDEMLANELRRPLNTVRLALNTFQHFGMIEIVDDILHLSSWEKYQSTDKLAEIRDQTRKRVAKCREKKLLSQGNATSNATVTLRNAIEEERDEEGDKEKETHSFILSEVDEADWNKPVENSASKSDTDDSITVTERDKRVRVRGILGGGLVMLSEAEKDDLLDKLSIDEFDKYVEIVKFCEAEGKSFKKKTHYQAILDMAMADRKKGIKK